MNIKERNIPDEIKGIGKIDKYGGVWASTPRGRKAATQLFAVKVGEKKVADSLEEAIRHCELKDGMTVSFHHHLRNGDYVVNFVMDKLRDMGFKNLTLASSSLNDIHSHLIDHIRQGVITKIITSGMRGDLGNEVSHGLMDIPVIFHSHGGRARMLKTGKLHVDLAFIAAPTSDCYGNLNGVNGPSACGPLGYANFDSFYAERVIAITDNLVEFPATPISIMQTLVDYVVSVDKLGDPKGISSGATRMTRDPKSLLIARYAADFIDNSGYLKEGYSFQAGSGGASLAVAHFIREKMISKGIKGSFGLGGITGYMVKLLEEGLFKTLFDVQSFDLEAVRSLRENKNHVEISAGYYANPFNKGCMVNMLDVAVLSALEIDLDFNVNVLTGSDGVIRGASGGHSDVAAGSKLTVVVAPSFRGRIPSIKDKVITVVTPGDCVDVLVTERGIAINPRREDLIERFKDSKLPVKTIEELQHDVEKITGKPKEIEFKDKIVGLVEYRDGTYIDVIREVAEH